MSLPPRASTNEPMPPPYADNDPKHEMVCPWCNPATRRTLIHEATSNGWGATEAAFVQAWYLMMGLPVPPLEDAQRYASACVLRRAEKERRAILMRPKA